MGGSRLQDCHARAASANPSLSSGHFDAGYARLPQYRALIEVVITQVIDDGGIESPSDTGKRCTARKDLGGT
jgi:hypothetical protein